MHEDIRSLLKEPRVQYEESLERINKKSYEELKKRIDDGLKYAAGSVVYRENSENSEILLIQNHWGDKWHMPGGQVEPGEKFEEAAKREVKEETGVEVVIEKPLKVKKQEMIYEGRKTLSTHFLIYSAKAESSNIDQELGEHEGEVQEAGWFGELPEDVRDKDVIMHFLKEKEYSEKL